MAWHVFITSPRAGVPGAVYPYTVECAPVFSTEAQAQAFADAGIMSAAVVALFDAMPSQAVPFAAGEDVGIGDLRAYDGKTWRCIQPHTTLANWAPPVVPALWTLVPLPGSTAWAQPVAYSLPSKTTYGGRLYQLIQPHTSNASWIPPNVPALWEDIGPATGVAAYTRAVWWAVSSDDAAYTEVRRTLET